MPSRDDLLTDRRRPRRRRTARSGGLVAIPTETVYGLAADARQPAAVARIFEIKGRPTNHPLIVHLAGVEAIDGWVGDTDAGHVVADRPARRRLLAGTADDAGPPRRSRCSMPSPVVGRSVGLRVPAHPTDARADQHPWHRPRGAVRESVRTASARRPRRTCSTTSATLLDPERDAVLDGGPCPVGVESTIVDLTDLAAAGAARAGAIVAEDVESILASPVDVGGRPEPRQRHARRPLRARLRGRAGRRLGTKRSASSPDDMPAGDRARVLDRTDDLVARRPRAVRRPPSGRPTTGSTRWWSCCRPPPDSVTPFVTACSRPQLGVADRVPVERIEAGDPGVPDQVEVGGRDAALGADASVRPWWPRRRATAPAGTNTASARRARRRAGTADRRRSSPRASSPTTNSASNDSAGRASIVNDGWSTRQCRPGPEGASAATDAGGGAGRRGGWHVRAPVGRSASPRRQRR